VTYEPNPPPDQVEAFQPFGGKPLTMLKVGAGLLARKGQAEPILEPSPKKRAELETRVTKETLLQVDSAAPEKKDKIETAPTADEDFETWGGELPPSGSAPSKAESKRSEGASVKRASAPAAAVSLELTAPEILRLNVASMRLNMSVDDILSLAVGAFLDAHKVPSTEACAKLLGDAGR
jgi:hypothetical protein